MAEGDIDVLKDTFEFEANKCYTPRIIHVVGDVYCIVFSDVDSDGQMLTVSIDAAGDIGAAALDAFQFDGGMGLQPRIIHISGDVFAIAYTRDDYDGWIKTISINAAGDIGGAPIDQFEYDTTKSVPQSIINISGSVYAIAYTGNLNKGWLTTVTINPDGSIDSPVIEKAGFLPATMFEPEIIHVIGNIYAIVYKGADDDGFILTISIDAAGDIGASIIDTFEFDPNYCEEPNIIHISGEIFAIVYKGPDSDGWLKTISINAAGDIGAAAIDSFEFAPGTGVEPNIIHISGDVYGISYTGPDSDGFFITVTIASDGAITEPVIDSFEFETVEADECYSIHVTGDIYAIVFNRGHDEGVLKTIGVETRLGAPPRLLPLMGIG